ncbi:mRNA cap guanine-N7 methyltransferase [Tulasnella sp. JGI-2019a]|nr:mRNA cap guanine-N7 methyltransferase [Tulasnella sp. JGI-2019a]KAG9012369.1 mRNA cap guanine-N7 methyltransferase [Tulasnella sp. JGI-2019a]KAG9036130.1 mRNA cap guanine-N7 methyltransferase [Tulasnella sp. JGI-2019a]
MPAFDPVRDAVANSPQTTSYPPLPSPGSYGTPTSATTPSSAFPFPPPFPQLSQSQSQSPPHPQQPPPPPLQLPQKRSSLSMLLNEFEPPRKTPRLGLAELLSPAPSTAELALPALSSSSTSNGAGVVPNNNARPSSSSSNSSQPHPLRFSLNTDASDSDHLSVASPSPTHSPARIHAVMASSPQAQIPSKPSFTPPRLPYNPRRITPAVSVLRPLTQAELSTWVPQNPLRNIDKPGKRKVGTVVDDTRPSLGKRTRDEARVNLDENDEPSTKRIKDSRLVALHYNARPEVGIDKRRESPIYGLKSFNNWIKSVLIATFAAPALQSSPNSPPPLPPLPPPPPSYKNNDRRRPPPPGRGKVLDMGCGKGGDLQKWAKARLSAYAGLDLASQSVNQAFHRWQDLTKRGGNQHQFDGEFVTLDCFQSPLANGLSPKWLQTSFDVVSLQFCMHYAFESEAKVRIMLDNVTRYLRPGGVFIGTVPNSHFLMEHLNRIPADATDLSWGNTVYTVRFDDRIRKTYGQRYSFFLKDAVDDVPEYVVHWEEFEKLASTYGLTLKYKQEFHQVFEDNQEHRDFGPLLQKMNVVDSNGESHMDEDQWEAANVYLAFTFEKV